MSVLSNFDKKTFDSQWGGFNIVAPRLFTWTQYQFRQSCKK